MCKRTGRHKRNNKKSMKRNLLKSIIMTVALVLGVASSWAATDEAVVKMTYVDYDNPTTAIGEIAAGETARSGYNKISNGEVGFGNTGWGENKITYIQVDASAINGTITGATLTADVSGSSDSKRVCTYGVGYNASTWSAGLTYETADKSITLVGNTYSTSTKSASTFEQATFDISNALIGDEDKVVTILLYETAAAGGYVKNPSVSITYLSDNEVGAYTVKYVCGETEVKEATTGVGAIGGTYTVTDEDKASCMFNDVKYIYVSDDAASQTIKQDGSTVITITFRQAEKFAYTVKNSLGTTIKEGTDWEGETLNIAYPRYIAQDGTLYSAGKGSTGWYLKTITLNQNNQEETVEYTAGEAGVIFLSEAEDIETLTVSTAANSNIRCSNGLGAYNAGESDAVITNLPNGKYKLYTSTWGGTGVDFVFKAGETTIGTFECLGSIKDYNTEEFELNAASTPITLGATSNAARCIDFVYIIKTGDAELTTPSIPAAENIAALKALADGTEATLTMNKAKILVSRGSMTGRTTVVEDESGVIAFGADLMGMLMEFEVTEGKAVTGKITGVYTVVNGIPTFAGSENTGSESAGDAVTAVEDFTVQGVAATIADTKKAENLLKVVTIKDLTLNYAGTGMREFTATQGTENITVVDAMMTPSWSYVTNEYMKEEEEGYNFPPFESMTALVYANANGTVLYPMELVAKVVREARVWHFDQLTAADEALLKEDEAWVEDKNNRYHNTTAPLENEVITVNDVELETTKGLLFTAAADKLLLGTATGKSKYMQLQKGASFVVTDLVAGDTLRAVVQSASKDELTLDAIDETLAKVVEGFEATKAKDTCTIVMLKDGEVKLSCSVKDIRFFTLEAIPGEAPAADGLTIAEIKALADGTDATLAVNGAKVTFVSGTDAYIEDETGALLIEGEGLNLTAGKAITGTINGKLTIVKEKLHKFVATEANVTEADAQIAATVLTIAEANKPENISKLVKLENVDANIDYQQIVDSNDEYIMFLDKYNVLGGENPKKVESIVGVLGFMGTNTNMFYPVSKDSIVAAPVVPAKEVKTIAEMKAVEDGTEVNFVMNNVKVTSISAGRMSSFGTIEDETGAIQLGSDMISSIFMEQGISEGMAVSGHVTGTYSVVDGIPTFDISENTGVADELTGTEATITPSEATIAGVKNAESISKYVILKDVKVTGVEEGFAVAFTAAQGEETIAVEDVMMDPLTREGVLSKYVEYGEDGSTTISLPEMFESMTAIVSIDWHGNYVLYPKAVVEKEAQEEIAVVWDFTKWSEETVNNLKADAATVEPDADGKYPAVTPWRSYEKAGGPTDTDPDRGGAAFWYGTAITEAQSLTANGTEIAETAGLLFDKMSAGALAIAVDYPSTSLGTYDGPSYLWIGGKNHTFVIPAVKPGSTIEIKVETHKNGDARGLKLSVGGEVIGEAIPTTVETFRIVVPASDAETVDVKVENTNGCHIYTIGINDYEKINTGISSIKSDVKAVSGVYTINGVKVRNAGESLDGLAKGLYIIDGKKVVIK